MGAAAGGKNPNSAAIYGIEIEDIRIAFLGPQKFSELTDEQKSVLEGSDIVLVPAGGKDVTGYEEAAKISTKLEPFYIIPHSYKISGLELELDKLDKFLKEMGGKHTEMEKFTVKKKELTGESTSLVVLTPMR